MVASYPECTETTDCVVCGASQSIVVARRARHGIRARNVACRRCGHVFQSPRPASEAVRAYQRELEPEARADFGATARHGKSRSAFVASMLDVSPGMRVLELEHGGGAALAYLRKDYQARVFGTARRPEDHEEARRLGISSFEGDLEDLEPENRRFERVVVTEALQQAPDPVALLIHLRGFLTPRARVLIQIPNLHQPRGPIGDLFQIGHLHSFDAFGLCTVLHRAGYRVELLAEDRFLSVVAEPDPFAAALPRGFRSDACGIERHDGQWVSECLLSYEALEQRRVEIMTDGPCTESVGHVVQLMERPHFFQHLADTIAELTEHLMDHGAIREAYAIAGASVQAPVEAPVKERFHRLAEAVGFELRKTMDAEQEHEAQLQAWLEEASRGAVRYRYQGGGPSA